MNENGSDMKWPLFSITGLLIVHVLWFVNLADSDFSVWPNKFTSLSELKCFCPIWTQTYDKYLANHSFLVGKLLNLIFFGIALGP